MSDGTDEWHNQWLVDRIEISEQLGRALGLFTYGRNSQRVTVLDRLADALRIDGSRLGEAGYRLLDGMLEPLAKVMADGPVPSSGVSADRHRVVVEETIAELEVDVEIPLDDLLAVYAEFNWQERELGPSQVAVKDVGGLVRGLFVNLLARQVFAALEKWRQDGAWPAGGYRPRHRGDRT